MNQLPDFKRVITAHDAQGRVVVAMSGATPNTFALKAVPGAEEMARMVFMLIDGCFSAELNSKEHP